MRLDETTAALGDEPRTAYAVSHDLFGNDLSPAARRFAVAETLSHLQRLVEELRAVKVADGLVGWIAGEALYTETTLGRRAT